MPTQVAACLCWGRSILRVDVRDPKMIPSFGMRVTLVFIACAPAIGVFIAASS